MFSARGPIMRLAYAAALLSTAAPLVSGCGGGAPRPHKLDFEITGSGQLSTLTYVVNGKATTETSVRLPWRKTIQLPAKEGTDTWQLKARQDDGLSQVVVSVDDRPISNGACQGGGCSSNHSGSIRD